MNIKEILLKVADKAHLSDVVEKYANQIESDHLEGDLEDILLAMVNEVADKAYEAALSNVIEEVEQYTDIKFEKYVPTENEIECGFYNNDTPRHTYQSVAGTIIDHIEKVKN